MSQNITGIHHLSALTSDAQRNLDFYSRILGLRLVKRTVNFDAPEIYHLYYGNAVGDAENGLTFFPYQDLPKGRHGKGMVCTTAFSVPMIAMDFWLDRLRSFDIPYKDPQERFGNEAFVYFEDFDGMGLELVFNDRDDRPGYAWKDIPAEHAVRGFNNVEIWAETHVRTAALLTEKMDHRLIAESGRRRRYAATDRPGSYVDILEMPESLKGLAGSGGVHHLAFSVPDETSLVSLRNKVLDFHLDSSPVLDRRYFKSIYFREPGGVLFEAATAGPGFTIDESIEELGSRLQLPAQYEDRREEITRGLSDLKI